MNQICCIHNLYFLNSPVLLFVNEYEVKYCPVNSINRALSPFHISMVIIDGLNMFCSRNPQVFCELNLANIE